MKRIFHTKQKFLQFEWISKGREKMKSSMYFTLAALVLLFTQGVQGQMVGWPASNTASCLTAQNKTINIVTPHPNNKYYLDEHRARVTAENTNGANYDLDLSNYSSTSTDFNDAGKWCLVIQMTGSNVGVHVLVEIVSLSSNTLTVSLPSGNTWPSFDYTTGSKIQIIKIETYWNLTLDKGEVTCHEFDHATGTGGVAPLIVGNLLEINGGWFNVSGKGYLNTAALGSGGSGVTAPPKNFAPGGGYPGGVGGNFQWSGSNICHTSTSPPAWVVNPGFAGGDGEGPDNNVNSGTSTSGETNYHPGGGSNYSNGVLIMGAAGSFGEDAGTGGGAGGFGGDGGVGGATNSNPGSAGLQGENGGKGGDAGKGGRGGGVMYFKIHSWDVHSDIKALSGDYKLFYADGGQGDNGIDGEDGGLGGEGGDGGLGECDINPSTLSAAGGWGGFGLSGIGAGGGDAGNGGKPGTIWLIKNSSGSFDPSSFSGYVSLRGGKGGGGGKGGYSGIFTANFEPRNYGIWTDFFDLMPCNTNPPYELCAIPEPCAIIQCDCNEVFKHWGENGSATFTIDATSNTNLWEIIFLSGSESIFYNSIDRILYLEKVVNTCSVRYNCDMTRKDIFDNMLKKMAPDMTDLKTYTPSSGTKLDVGMTLGVYNAGGSFETELFAENPTHRSFIYYPQSKFLIDVDDPALPFVFAGNCSEEEVIYAQGTGTTSGPGGPPGGSGNPVEPGVQTVIVQKQKTGPDGKDGDDENDGQFNDLFEESDGPSVFDDEHIANLEYHDIANPKNFISKYEMIYSGTVEISMIETIPDASICKIYSMDGKHLATDKIVSGKVRFNNLSAGVYIIKLESPGFYGTQRILVVN